MERIMSRLGAEPPQSVSIVGARRAGKSSLLWHIAQNEVYARYLDKPERYAFIFFDFQGQQHLGQSGFCRVFGEHLSAACGDRFTVPALDDFEGMEATVRDLSARGLQLVCLFDEFEAVTRNPGFGEEFFGLLRALANAHSVAFVTTSHLTLQSLCHTSQISESPFFNIFAELKIGPFNEAEVKELVAKPSASAGTPLSTHEETLVDLSGHLPLFLQIACAAAFECLNENQDHELIHSLLEQRFMEEAVSHFRYIWDHFDEAERETAVILAVNSTPTAALSTVRSLLGDGFVRNVQGRTRLFSASFSAFAREQMPEVPKATAGSIPSPPSSLEPPMRSAIDPVAEEEDPFPQIVGRSIAIRRVFALMQKAVVADDTVLLTGETGTGKELVARCIHESSRRGSGPFVAVNCGAIAEHLQESELFGHKKGAFTDAAADREGLFEAAHEGTLFLDEIGEVGSATQVKLLRVLQEGEIRRVGENHARQVDIRLICATNRNLEEEVEAGRFRQDLYYRLYVIALELPALRDRTSDIRLLVDSFLAEYPAGTTEDAVTHLNGYSWPGNIRELENQLASARAMAGGDAIRPQHLWPRLQLAAAEDVNVGGFRTELTNSLSFKEAREQFERDLIQSRLERHDWEIGAAAEALDISRSRLYELVKRHGLKRE